MRILVLLLCLTAINGYAQERGFMQLMHMQNISAMLKGDISFDFNDDEVVPVKPVVNEEDEIVSPKNLKTIANSDDYIDEPIEAKGQKIETHNVSIFMIDGIEYHVADYIDGTRVMTCLNGTQKGLQLIVNNGVIMAASEQVEWKKKYFVHRYTDGKIYSYPHKQIAELK